MTPWKIFLHGKMKKQGHLASTLHDKPYIMSKADAEGMSYEFTIQHYIIIWYIDEPIEC